MISKEKLSNEDCLFGKIFSKPICSKTKYMSYVDDYTERDLSSHDVSLFNRWKWMKILPSWLYRGCLSASTKPRMLHLIEMIPGS